MANGERDPALINDGEKYALIGVHLDVDPGLASLDLPGGVSVLSSVAFKLPNHWRKLLGTTGVERVEKCGLYVLATMPSK